LYSLHLPDSPDRLSQLQVKTEHQQCRQSLDPFGDKWTVASSKEVSSPEQIQKRAGLA